MGVVPALNALGIAHFNGWGVPRDTAKAIDYLRRAANLGDPEAMTNLAAATLGGEVSGHRHWILQEDFDEALALLEASALRGRRGALLQLGALLVGAPRTYVAPPARAEGRVEHMGARDCPRGVALLRLLVEMWGPCAYALARALQAYKDGRRGRALMLYLRAAALGSSVGMANAAHLLLASGGDDGSAPPWAALPRAERRAHVARALLREAHGLGNTDASIALADLLFDDAAATAAAANVAPVAPAPAAAATPATSAAPAAPASPVAPVAPTAPAAEVAAERRADAAADLYAEALELYEHSYHTVSDPEALHAMGHMHQHGLGTHRDLDEAARLFGELSGTQGETLPGLLAQLGVHLQRASSWLSAMVSAREQAWW